MATISDAFLLEVAAISSTLLGFFVVGVFFYVQRGVLPQAADAGRIYVRTAVRSVMVLYGMTLSLSLTLVAFSVAAAAMLYASLSLVLVWSVGRASLEMERLHRVTDVRVMWRAATWTGTALIVVLPWVLGGFTPSRTDITSGMLVAGALAFVSSVSLMLSAFDISTLEAEALGEQIRSEGSAPRLDGDAESSDGVVDAPPSTAEEAVPV